MKQQTRPARNTVIVAAALAFAVLLSFGWFWPTSPINPYIVPARPEPGLNEFELDAFYSSPLTDENREEQARIAAKYDKLLRQITESHEASEVGK